MSIYRYAGNSVIQEASFHHAEHRLPVALLTAAPNALPDQLSAIRLAIGAVGWQSVPVYVEGHPALQISGFKQDVELDNLLHANHFVEGDAAITRDSGDDTKVSHGDRLRHISLKLAGLFNLVGNTGMVIDGAKKRDPYRVAGGSLLTLGAVNLVRYGNAKPEYYERVVAEDMAKFMRDQGIQLPQGSRLSDIIQHKRTGALADAESFLYQHPAQVTLGVDSVGAGALLASGIKKAQNKEGWGGLGFGIGSLGLKLTSMIVPEKTQDEIKQDGAIKKRNPIQKAIGWIQEKPLRFYGMGSLASDLFLGADAYHQYSKNPGKKGYIYTAVAATSYTLADLMYTISSKNHVNDDGKFNPDEQRGIEAMAAESLAQQPEMVRSAAAQKLGTFLQTIVT